MRKLKTYVIALFAACLLAFAGCGNSPSSASSALQDASPAQISPSASSNFGSATTSSNSISNSPSGTYEMIDISIMIDGQLYTAKLYDNETTKELIGLFPLDIQMGDLSSNEKYYYLPESLPTNAESVSTIHSGDIMLYGSDCLVLFYKSFSTSYRYTRLGYMDDVYDLRGLLGDGDVTVVFSFAA